MPEYVTKDLKMNFPPYQFHVINATKAWRIKTMQKESTIFSFYHHFEWIVLDYLSRLCCRVGFCNFADRDEYFSRALKQSVMKLLIPLTIANDLEGCCFFFSSGVTIHLIWAIRQSDVDMWTLVSQQRRPLSLALYFIKGCKGVYIHAVLVCSATYNNHSQSFWGTKLIRQMNPVLLG